MEEKLDIVTFIEKNPLTRVASNYNDKFIKKIKDSFSDTQQQLFITNFYCYLNYNSKTDFVIDLDNIWKWLGFARKGFCKTLLEKHFKENTDYIISKETNEANFATAAEGAKFASKDFANRNLGGAGQNKETIMLNINTFKKLCLKSNTKKADEIHDLHVTYNFNKFFYLFKLSIA